MFPLRATLLHKGIDTFDSVLEVHELVEVKRLQLAQTALQGVGARVTHRFDGQRHHRAEPDRLLGRDLVGAAAT